jgi:hypothetical protein
MIQCEIPQHENLDFGPPDEEPVPPQPDDQGPPLFDFFGLGQHVLEPVGAHEHQLLQNQGNPAPVSRTKTSLLNNRMTGQPSQRSS